MEITGKLYAILPEVSGEGRNGRWVKNDFVIETEDKYPKKVCLTAWGDQVEQVKNLAIATTLKVGFDVDSREYQGKWYTNLKAWKIDVLNDATAAPPQQVQHNHTSPTNNEPSEQQPQRIIEDDLPF